jgi:hypothetical protein
MDLAMVQFGATEMVTAGSHATGLLALQNIVLP